MSAVKPLFLMSAGALFVWSGVRGGSVLGSLRDVVAGVQPKAGTMPIVTTALSTGGGVPGQGNSAIANDALRYTGTPYVWAGANPPHGADCSGGINAVCNRDLGLAIPGVSAGHHFTGHGPATPQWFSWRGMTTIKSGQEQAGDIVVWLTHMGVFTAPGQVFSWLNPSLGARVLPVKDAAPRGEPMRIGRMK
jgi:peptidoglycan DL-endopeptidase CwlO